MNAYPQTFHETCHYSKIFCAELVHTGVGLYTEICSDKKDFMEYSFQFSLDKLFYFSVQYKIFLNDLSTDFELTQLYFLNFLLKYSQEKLTFLTST